MFLSSLTPDEKEELYYRWEFWARDNQLAPRTPFYLWLILAGRGFGKTRMGAEWIRARAESGQYSRFALVGQTAGDVRDVMIEGESGILAVSPKWFRPRYEPSKRRLTWPNGAIATTYSGDEPDQLRGPQHDSAWADEPAKWRYLQESWDNLEMGLRLGTCPQAVATTTPRPIPWLRAAAKDPQTVATRGKTADNRANLNPVAVARMLRKYEGTRLGRQELDGEILDDNPDALWRREKDIEAHRKGRGEVPSLIRIVIGVDPQAADNQESEAGAETGIIVAGLAGGDVPHAYILDDLSLRDSPNKWAGAAVDGYVKYMADRIVGEQNNGGAMVEFTVRTVARDKGVTAAYKGVHASRGKLTRAEPIAALYEQGRIHHVGAFATLEDQMCNWMPGQPSPDRMDALVWALTELMLENPAASKTPGVSPFVGISGKVPAF